tara:strand:- start:3476 stop:4144 length:669 start_codon:yes stop_codon:yes gene_type:complete
MALGRFIEGTAFGVMNDILSTFHSDDGYAQPNRFEVKISRPSLANINLKQLSMRCESITLPGRNLNTLSDTNIYGPSREIVNGITYADEITMTFQASSDLKERVYFEEWQESAFDERSWNVRYYNEYTSEIDIYLLDKNDKKRYGLKLWEAFPKTINATELNQGTNNEIIKLDVVFSFRYWTTLDIDRQKPNLGEKIFDTITTGVERQLSSNLPRVLTKLKF